MTQINTGTGAGVSTAPRPRRKQPRRTVSIRQAARFNAALALSGDSPSGLVWGQGSRRRNVGDPAGCEKKAQPGYYVVRLDGVLWSANTIKASLQALYSVAGQAL